MASEPSKLAIQLDAADSAQTDGESELDTFFATGETRLDAAAFIASLREWRRDIAGVLPKAERFCFYFLCALEERDRHSMIIGPKWPTSGSG